MRPEACAQTLTNLYACFLALVLALSVVGCRARRWDHAFNQAAGNIEVTEEEEEAGEGKKKKKSKVTIKSKGEARKGLISTRPPAVSVTEHDHAHTPHAIAQYAQTRWLVCLHSTRDLLARTRV